MPRKTDFCRLRDCVRDEIASALHDGGGRAREIARSVCAKHRDLIGVLGERLAEDAVTRLVNREIKKWSAVGTAEREQLVLPGMLTHLLTHLPASISVPSADDADDDDPIYRPLFGPKCATVGELRAAVAALWKSIADDQRKAEALTQLLDLLISAGAGDDLPVSEALQRTVPRSAAGSSGNTKPTGELPDRKAPRRRLGPAAPD